MRAFFSCARTSALGAERERRVALGISLDHVAEDILPAAVATGLNEFFTLDDKPLISLKLLWIFEDLEKPLEFFIVLEEVS